MFLLADFSGIKNCDTLLVEPSVFDDNLQNDGITGSDILAFTRRLNDIWPSGFWLNDVVSSKPTMLHI